MADPAQVIANSVNQNNDASDEEYSDYPEFPVPDGFTPPQGTQTGEPFQALGTFRMKSDDTMCLLAVDGSPVKGDKDDTDETDQDQGAAQPAAPNAGAAQPPAAPGQ
jgi:hypothetical protein